MTATAQAGGPRARLKRQLLGELAALAQLDARDLSDVWSQTSARDAARAHGASRSSPPPSDAYAGADSFDPPHAPYGTAAPAQPRFARRSGGQRGHAPAWSNTPRSPRTAPAGRADHAARLLLSHMDFLDSLSHEDHAALCALPPPHGPLFAWIESQFHEHGVRSWALLREDLRGHESEAFAERVMTGSHAQTEGETPELRMELRGLLNRLLIEQIKQQQDQAIAQAAQDPAALQRYRDLEARRKALEKLASPAS